MTVGDLISKHHIEVSNARDLVTGNHMILLSLCFFNRSVITESAMCSTRDPAGLIENLTIQSIREIADGLYSAAIVIQEDLSRVRREQLPEGPIF